MKVGCKAFDSENDSEVNFRKKTNMLWADFVFERAEEFADETYVVSDSKELMPIHLVTDSKDQDSFTVYAGLILFHFTVHDTEMDFQYPNSGSFFATTLAHSLHVAFEEKKDEIMRVTSRARLIIYQLKRDITVKDSPGDAIDCGELGLDGVVAGYRGGYTKSGREILGNLNELRLCVPDMEDALIYLAEIPITAEIVQDRIFKHALSTQMVHNQTFSVNVCPGPELNEWSYISNGLGQLYLFEKLRDKVDDIFRFLLFCKVDTYVLRDADSVVILVPWTDVQKVGETKISSMVAKVWSPHGVKWVWPLLKKLVGTYDKIKETSEVGQEKGLFLEPDVLMKLRQAGVPVDDFM